LVFTCSDNIKFGASFSKHPDHEGVFVKHFFGKDSNDALNNMEVRIVPDFQVSPHSHDNSTEYFYVVEGEVEFGDGAEWLTVQKGDAFKAPQGMVHAIRNSGRQTEEDLTRPGRDNRAPANIKTCTY